MNVKLSALTIGLLVGSMVFTSPVSAAFIDNDTYTTDTESGLDWLDVTASVNQSYDYVSSQFYVGGEYEGWQFASGIEFNQMLTNYTGVTIPPDYTLTVDYEPGILYELINMFGNTSNIIPDAAVYTIGNIFDKRSSATNWQASFIEHPWFTRSLMHNSYRDTDAPQLNAGSFLVRDTIAPVPVPPAIILMLSGIIGLFGVSRSKKIFIK